MAGCSRSLTEPSAFTLSTQRTQYAAGDAATVMVTDHSGRTIEYGACEAYALDVRVGTAWREVQLPARNYLCTAVAYVLPPDGTRPVTVRLPDTLTPATYRVRIVRFEPATTNAFDVR